MKKYYKNLILCGEIDYYCLLCEESFECPEQLEKHVRWEQHRKNIKNIEYVPKLKKDFIFKIGNYNYCEICNYVTTVTAIKDHINDDKHKFRKVNPTSTEDVSDIPVVRNKNGSIKCHDMTLNKLQWHGIVDDHCALCNIDEESGQHIEKFNHMITLIQSRIIVTDDNQCYRKVNDDEIYCFTCKTLYSIDSLHGHEITEDDLDTDIDVWNKLKIGEANYYLYTEKILEVEDEEDIIFNTLIKAQRKYFYIDLKKSVARCYRCKLVLQDITIKLLNIHKKGHNIENDESDSSDDTCEYSEITDHGKRRSELAKYGKNHFIKLNAKGSKGYCSLCDVYMSASLIVFKEHMRGTIHQGMLLTKGLKKGLRHDNQIRCTPGAKPLHAVVTNVLIDNNLNFICINNNIFMDLESFLLIKQVQDKKTKCLVCDEIYKKSEIKDHCLSKLHRVKLTSCFLMISGYEHIDLANEFIRKVKTDLYHCGPCNQLIPYWDTTHLHLKSNKHTTSKNCKKLLGSFVKRYCTTGGTQVVCKNSNTLLQKLDDMGLFQFSLL